MRKNQDTWVAIYAALVTFLTYATIYAFRKPFTVGIYEQGPRILGVHYKDALVISQVLGYMLSKFYGIRFIAELKKRNRGKMIAMLVGISWLALLMFALAPAPWNVIFLFVNGFPLGITWGIIFSYVEGRRATDFIGSALAVSFIFSSGFVKSIGKILMVDYHVPENWMPAITGLLFMLPLICFIILLERIPPPSDADVESKVTRPAMTRQERKKFFRQFGTGLTLLVCIYVFLTLFRDIRDNFAADMWKELGYDNQPALFTATEAPIAVMVLVLISSMILIRNNRKAFVTVHYIIIAGFLIAGLSSFLFTLHLLPPFEWMVCTGLGLYMGYIPFNCVLFDRMIAAFRQAGNVGFLMYVADSFGYLASVGVIISKSVISSSLPWTKLYSQGVVVLSIVGLIATAFALIYFQNKYHTAQNQIP